MNRRHLLLTGVQGLVGLTTTSLFATSPTSLSLDCACPADRLIRICCNENPYGPSPMARKAIQEHIEKGNRYPRSIHATLIEDIAKENGVTPEHVILGAGSASILQLTGLWLALQKKNILSADYTFRWMMTYAGRLGSKWIKVPLTEDMHFDLQGIKNRLDKHIGLVYLCNPNNPTGTFIPLSKLHAFCKEISPTHPVFVDEAYIEYVPNHVQNNTARLIANYPNVMVSRTFSKLYGLAGLRVGYLIANPKIIKELKDLDVGFGMTISCTSIAAAKASLRDEAFKKSSLEKNEQARQFMQRKLDDWSIPYPKGVANFIHADVSNYGKTIKSTFQAKQISLNPIHQVDKTYLRITLGTMEEMEIFAKRMESFFT